MDKKDGKSHSASEICLQFDITKSTLFKWEREGKISKVKKDWRGGVFFLMRILPK